MFFYIYLKEIKFRLIYSFITFFITLICLYFYSDILLEFLISNLLKIKNNSLIFISITESFFAHLNFSFKFSFIITLFIFLLHVWLFIKPSLYCYENFYCKIFGFIFIISLLIANYIVLVYLLPIFFSRKAGILPFALVGFPLAVFFIGFFISFYSISAKE